MKKLKLLLLSFVFTVVCTFNVFAVSFDELESLKNKIQANIDSGDISKNKWSAKFDKTLSEDGSTLAVSIDLGTDTNKISAEFELYKKDLNSDVSINKEGPSITESLDTYYFSDEETDTIKSFTDTSAEDSYATIFKNIETELSNASKKANGGIDKSEFKSIIKAAQNEVSDIKHGMKDEGINPTWQIGAQYMNNQGAGVKYYINLGFSIFLWFLWIAFLGFELLNGAIILFPVVRDKVTGDGATIPWYITHNTAERLKNMEEEPMKKWFTGEVGRIITFFLISVGIFSGLIMAVISALLNLIPA